MLLLSLVHQCQRKVIVSTNCPTISKYMPAEIHHKVGHRGLLRGRNLCRRLQYIAWTTPVGGPQVAVGQLEPGNSSGAVVHPVWPRISPDGPWQLARVVEAFEARNRGQDLTRVCRCSGRLWFRPVTEFLIRIRLI